MERIKVRAQDLRKADYLPLSKETVVGVTTSGLVIPAGKVEVILGGGITAHRLAYWNKTTEILVERQEVA